MNYWLMKTEADCYSIDDLKRDKITPWNGVRNYQARNFMRDNMNIGDRVLIYHSNGNPSGIAGIGKVSSKPHLDESQFDKNDEHYDPKSKCENPTWICVDVGFVKKFKQSISLHDLKTDPATAGMIVCQKGSRLSIQPVSERHYNYIIDNLT